MNDEYSQSLKGLKDSLDNWAQVTIHNSESKLAKGMLSGILDTSKLVDQFATWLLAGAGATSVLLISNLESISTLVGSINYQITLGFVCLAMVFGVLEKVAALRITIYRSAEQAGEIIAAAVQDEHKEVEDKIEEMGKPHSLEVKADINIEHVFSMVIDAYPKIFKKRLERIIAKTVNEPMYGQKKAIRIYLWQSLFASIEVISFILFAGSVVVGV